MQDAMGYFMRQGMVGDPLGVGFLATMRTKFSFVWMLTVLTGYAHVTG
jgi:hypothetical protein